MAVELHIVVAASGAHEGCFLTSIRLSKNLVSIVTMDLRKKACSER
jgi:hypothetical protein